MSYRKLIALLSEHGMEYTFTITITDVHVWQFIIIGGLLGVAYAYALYGPWRALNDWPVFSTTIGVAGTLALLWLVGGFPLEFVLFLAAAFAVTGGIPNFIRLFFELHRRSRLAELKRIRDQQDD